MRKINILGLLSLFALSMGFTSCENEDVKFDDYGSVRCSFPIQTPVRTLILGDYDLGDNTNDNNHQFEIGASLTGLYENNSKSRKIYFELDNSLLNGVTNVEALPSDYYTIVTQSPVSFPKGDFKARIVVKLNDAFFNDEKAVADGVNYVLPLRITQIENIDSVMSGKPAVANPNRLVASDWSIAPKDYILYGVKFINKFDASYLRRGVDKVLENGTQVAYHNQYMERDEVVKVVTSSLKQVKTSNSIRRAGAATPGNIALRVVFDDADKCKIYNDETDELIGEGKFEEKSEQGIYSKVPHNTMFLNYKYKDAVNNETHQVSDTLVYRNRNVVYQTFDPEFGNN